MLAAKVLYEQYKTLNSKDQYEIISNLYTKGMETNLRNIIDMCGKKYWDNPDDLFKESFSYYKRDLNYLDHGTKLQPILEPTA